MKDIFGVTLALEIVEAYPTLVKMDFLCIYLLNVQTDKSVARIFHNLLRSK